MVMKNLCIGTVVTVVMFCSGAFSLAHGGGHDMDFTAFGNRPGWQLAIKGSSRKVEFRNGAETLVYRYPALAPGLRSNGKTTVYMVPNDDHVLSVHIYQTHCQDNMTGTSYETSVTVMLDGTAYHGCGSAFQ